MAACAASMCACSVLSKAAMSGLVLQSGGVSLASWAAAKREQNTRIEKRDRSMNRELLTEKIAIWMDVLGSERVVDKADFVIYSTLPLEYGCRRFPERAPEA